MRGLRYSKGLLLLLLFSMAIRFLGIPCHAETEVYRCALTDKKQIALTFDDGPHPKLTPRILEILERYNVKATFFMVGENIVNYPEAAQKVLSHGHEIGNHTYSHRHIAQLDEESLEDELGLCEDALEELFEYRPHLFRPPEGEVTGYVKHCSERGDYALVLWSLDTRDWECRDASVIEKTVREKVRPGDIILMHDFIGRKSKTPEALEVLIPELLRRGYEFVTVSQLLGLQ